MKAFFIHPVRGISENYADGLMKQKEYYQKQGYEVYDPLTDTDQNDGCGLRICQDNRKAIEEADIVLFAWDGKSQGCLFDLGMAFAMRKKIVAIIGYVPALSDDKSFQNMVYALEAEQEKI